MRSFFFSISLIISCFSFSQEVQKKTDSTHIQEQKLEEVMITATRTYRQVSSLPLPAQIVTKKEIEAINSVRLSDILNEQTGVITIPDFGGGEGVQMQGFDSQYILILIDGVPLVGRSAGTLDMNRITLGNVKQIEVVKGASSSLYGSEALGGVINIITEKKFDGLHGSVNYRFSDYNVHDGNLALAYGADKISVKGFFNRYSSDGYDLNPLDITNTVDPFSNYTISSQLRYEWSEKTAILVSGRYYDQKQEVVSSAGNEGEGNLEEWNARVKISHSFSEKTKGYLDIYSTQYKAEEFLQGTNGEKLDESFFDQRLQLPEARMTYTVNKNHSFIGGVGWKNERLERTSFSDNPEFNSQYVYVQYDGHFFGKLNVIPGFRFDNHSEYASHFSPKIALRYNISDRVAVKTSVGVGFKAPDFRQLYFDFTNSSVGYTVLGYNAAPTRIRELQALGLINRIVIPLTEFDGKLKSESSVNYNLGLVYKPIEGLSVDINAFRNDLKDMIETQVIANKTNGQNVFSYQNISKVYTYGIETNVKYKISPSILFTAGYQLLYAKDKEAQEAFENGQVFARDPETLSAFQLSEKDYFGLLNRSRHMINGKIFYTHPRWKLNTNIRATYRSKYGLFDSNNNTYLDDYDVFVEDYVILDWAINKTIYESYTMSFGVDNIFDYTDAANISNLPGRMVYGKVMFKF